GDFSHVAIFWAKLSPKGANVRGLAAKILFGLLGGMFPVARWASVRDISKGVRWTVHFVLLALALGGLWYFDYRTKLSKDSLPGVRFLKENALWLPFLFLLLFGLAWIVWWLWDLITRGPERQEYEEIDRAWAEAREALEQAGLDLLNLPLFLVLGRPE